jgi:hypothetical protein
MNILQIAILVFVVIESLNVLTLYFNAGSRIGNGLGVFNAFKVAEKDEVVGPFVRYLIDWVAGAKLIFVMVGIAVLFSSEELVHMLVVIAFIISILSFYYRLFPMIKRLDKEGQITPKGYSKTLNYMIIGFLAMFIVALVIHLVV